MKRWALVVVAGAVLLVVCWPWLRWTLYNWAFNLVWLFAAVMVIPLTIGALMLTVAIPSSIVRALRDAINR